jgi:hypothetical protein
MRIPPKKGQGWIEIKTIKGHEYVYLRWYDGKVKRSSYIGKVSETFRRVISSAGKGRAEFLAQVIGGET